MDDKEFWVGTSLARLSDDEMTELQEEVAEELGQSKGFGGIASIAAALGIWRARPGGNLRVGLRDGQRFRGISGMPEGSSPIEGPVSVVMERLMMPDLPGNDVAIQLNWTVRNFFEDKAHQIGHVTCVTADKGAPARAVGVPLFSNLTTKQGLDIIMGAFAITDPKSNPIVNILSSDAFKVGVKVARRFNPVFATTVSYIQALTAGVMSRKRNYKLTEWRVGMGTDTSANIPLLTGEYILLDGRIRSGGSAEDVAWERITWNPEKERVEYDGEPFKNPHVIIHLYPTPQDAEEAAEIPPRQTQRQHRAAAPETRERPTRQRAP